MFNLDFEIFHNIFHLVHLFFCLQSQFINTLLNLLHYGVGDGRLTFGFLFEHFCRLRGDLGLNLDF